MTGRILFEGELRQLHADPALWHLQSYLDIDKTVRALEERALIAEAARRGAERALSDYREIHDR